MKVKNYQKLRQIFAGDEIMLRSINAQEQIDLLREIVEKSSTEITMKGATMIKGEPGHTPTDEELLALIKPLIPVVEDGKNGHTPTDKELLTLIRPLIPVVKDGKTPSDTKLISLIKPLIPEVKDGETPSDTKLKALIKPLIPDAEEIDEEKLAKDIIALIKKKKLLNSSDINGMQGFSRDGINYRFEELMHGGGGSSGGSITYSFDLSSQCDGVNKIFTVPSNTNFVLLTGTDAPIIYKLNTDYTGSGTTTLTLTAAVFAPSSGATLILTYIV